MNSSPANSTASSPARSWLRRTARVLALVACCAAVQLGTSGCAEVIIEIVFDYFSNPPKPRRVQIAEVSSNADLTAGKDNPATVVLAVDPVFETLETRFRFKIAGGPAKYEKYAPVEHAELLGNGRVRLQFTVTLPVDTAPTQGRLYVLSQLNDSYGNDTALINIFGPNGEKATKHPEFRAWGGQSGCDPQRQGQRAL